MGLAKAVSALAAGGKHVDPKYIATAEAYLKVFFLDPETRMTPDVTYAQCCLGDHPLVGDKTFVVAVSRKMAWSGGNANGISDPPPHPRRPGARDHA